MDSCTCGEGLEERDKGKFTFEYQRNKKKLTCGQTPYAAVLI
jgi:hypothetical protein